MPTYPRVFDQARTVDPSATYGRSAADHVLFVSTAGDDANDGLLPGPDRAKATLDGAITAAGSGGYLIQLGAGTYTEPAGTPPNNMQFRGVGAATIIQLDTASATLFTLTNAHDVVFSDLKLQLTANATGSTLLTLDNTFKCHFQNVTFVGQHTSATGSTYRTQIGTYLTGNSGDNTFRSCLFANLGAGVRTETVMNYLIGCDISHCWRGIWGGDPTGAAYIAGMSVDSTTFVSNAATTDRHVYVDGTANIFWLTNVWMEGCDRAADIGAGTYGPYAVGLVNVKMASTTATLAINAARQTTLVNVDLNVDPTTTPTDLSINATNAPDGFAANILSHQVTQIPRSAFPVAWTYFGRTVAQLPTLNSACVVDTTADATLTPLSINGHTNAPNLFEIKRNGTTYYSGDRYGNVTLRGRTTSGSFQDAIVARTLSGDDAVTFDGSTGGFCPITLNANATSSSIANVPPSGFSGRLTIEWIQGAGGSHTYVWPTNCKFAGETAPTPSTTAGLRDSVTFRYDGTNWIEVGRAVGVG